MNKKSVSDKPVFLKRTPAAHHLGYGRACSGDDLVAVVVNDHNVSALGYRVPVGAAHGQHLAVPKEGAVDVLGVLPRGELAEEVAVGLAALSHEAVEDDDLEEGDALTSPEHPLAGVFGLVVTHRREHGAILEPPHSSAVAASGQPTEHSRRGLSPVRPLVLPDRVNHVTRALLVAHHGATRGSERHSAGQKTSSRRRHRTPPRSWLSGIDSIASVER